MGARTWRCTASLCLEWCPAFNAFSTSWVYSPYWADEKRPVLQFRALIRMWQSSPRLQCTLSLTQRWMISTIFNLSWCWWVQSWCRFAVRCVTWQWICIELYRWLMIAVFCWGTFGFFSFGFDTSMPHFHSILSSFFSLDIPSHRISPKHVKVESFRTCWILRLLVLQCFWWVALWDGWRIWPHLSPRSCQWSDGTPRV